MTSTERMVLKILDEMLGLQGRALAFHGNTPLLGAVPELDSMAVVAIVTAIEESFGVMLNDEDISAKTFSTVGALVDHVRSRLSA